jgi:hypothetical protein
MQFAWKDSKLVLMASTGYNGEETVSSIRHRPSTEDRQNRPLRSAFGDDPELLVEIPSFAVDYNNYPFNCGGAPAGTPPHTIPVNGEVPQGNHTTRH